MASDNDCHCGEQDVAPPERKPDNLSRLLSDYSNAAYDCGAYTESEADYRGKLEVWMAARKVVEDFIRTGRAPVAAEPVLTAQSTEDDEIRRMQNGVRDHLILLGVPDSRIDGAGCDSGDPLDFTKAEISQAFNFFEDQHNEQIAAIRKALDACEAHADDIVELNVILRKVDWEALTVLIKGEKKG
jgi:hypothetical protein